MDFEWGIEAEELELEIAGFDVTCLLWDQDDVEAAVRSLMLFPQFEMHFQNAFDLISTATSFWLEDGSYSPCAESITRILYYLRDAIYDHADSAEAGSLPSVIRGLLGSVIPHQIHSSWRPSPWYLEPKLWRRSQIGCSTLSSPPTVLMQT